MRCYEGMSLLDKIALLLQFYFHRGDSFRTEFSHLGELSIIPEAVKVMALTVMATKASRREIIQSIDMQKPELIIVPPVKQHHSRCCQEVINLPCI